MGRIRIGTASWTDKSLIESGLYYPLGCTSAEARLKFYAAEFSLVEVDSSYYALPSERNSALWVERTPPDFMFNVKAFRLFTTHQTEPRALPRLIREQLPAPLVDKRNLYYKDMPEELKESLWRMFGQALAPLREAGKLGVIVFQFPPWFVPKEEAYRHLEECQARLPGCSLAVEFRHRSWLEGDNLEQTLAFLRHHHISFIAVDEPQGSKSSVPPVADVTGEYGIVRFHGRNSETWEAKGLTAASQRFDYYYSRPELEAWVPKIALMLDRASEVHLVLNTNNQDQGIANARLLGEILGEQMDIEHPGLR
jgi:uncharacterized protein YecE (DUF72 family)